MVECIYNLIKTIAGIDQYDGTVVEIGSRLYSKWDFRNCIKYDRYIGYDLDDGPGVDTTDSKTLPYRETDVIICTSVLEHDVDPLKTISLIKRLLRDNGKAIVTIPFYYRMHSFPSDYWRFTPDGLKLVLKREFFNVITFGVGREIFPHNVIGLINSVVSNEEIKSMRKKYFFEDGFVKGVIREMLPYWCYHQYMKRKQ